ncbi:PLP-dependent aminotransferase family protein [Virgibacillus sp. LDC1]|uniref:MocR-like pyridoxine biosynthesis transcription factor PdxR n=1 Tax=Paenibacillus sp. GM2FR TaxID=2059268 RepID=UPI000C270C7A|nr:PLP-dependent aminotransferase family protein [Paenibacillus sp. GM2FR]MCV4231723.1 PLP-dependent aminotransferase family protein [Virgibacillus sp. LDC1]PJN55629.1 HTH-type transcriptional regulatory protein GabR [Paenibacillus sp. GM2FR]
MYGIYINRESKLPVTRQICQQLRRIIEAGQLTAGTRLLPTRVLAKEWGIARNVVIEVYEQLTAEGYLEGRIGSGTYVAEGILPSPNPRTAPPSSTQPIQRQITTGLEHVIDFATGVPDQNMFPRHIWAKYLKEAAESSEYADPDYGHIKGDSALRSAICDYVFRAKGIQCSPEQMVIVSGATEGFTLLARSLSSRFHSIYIEDPTIDITRDIFQTMNYNLIPVEVDHSGMRVDTLASITPGHLVLLTPSHQFPTGSVLSIQRRHQVIRMLEEADSFAIEDDYDSEFRLRGIPVPPLQTLSPSRVIYVGTFSKMLSPSLRIGFMIVPPSLTDTIAEMKDKLNLQTPYIIQKALSQYMLDGHLERHIHTMKKMYKKRRNALTERLQHLFGQDISILGDDAGMHLQIIFHPEPYALLPWNDTASYGFRVEPVSNYRISSSSPLRSTGIVLGYGNLSLEEIEEGLRRLYLFASSCRTST